MVEGALAAKMMGIVAAGLILWVVLSNPQTSYAEDDSPTEVIRTSPLRSSERVDSISSASVSGGQVCSPSSLPTNKS